MTSIDVPDLVPPDVQRRYRREGFWTDITLAEVVTSALSRNARRTVAIHSVTTPWKGRLTEVSDLARAFASGLHASGFAPGQVLVYQLNNSLEALVVLLGSALAGAVIAPVPPSYTSSELSVLLERVMPAALILEQPGSSKAGHNANEMADLAPSAELLIPIDAGARLSSLEWLLDRGTGHATVAMGRFDPRQAALIGFTAGTTGEPKPVVHTHETITSELRQLGAVQPVDQAPMLVAAPIAHAIGMLSGVLLPLVLDRDLHLQDVWNPRRVLALLASENVTAGSGPPFFIQSLLPAIRASAELRHKLRYVGLGGALTPRELEEELLSLGISVVRMYGSTEHPSVTGASHTDPPTARAFTDGHSLHGVEVRVTRLRDRAPCVGEIGYVESRGPDLFAGYLDEAANADAVTADGWFRSNDLGLLREDGYLTIKGRADRVIIRGGQNIEPEEVENAIARHPAISECAVVGVPDSRLGQACIAFAVARTRGEIPSLISLRQFLTRAGLSPKKLPTRLIEIARLPRTTTGKLQTSSLQKLALDPNGSSAEKTGP